MVWGQTVHEYEYEVSNQKIYSTVLRIYPQLAFLFKLISNATNQVLLVRALPLDHIDST